MTINNQVSDADTTAPPPAPCRPWPMYLWAGPQVCASVVGLSGPKRCQFSWCRRPGSSRSVAGSVHEDLVAGAFDEPIRE